jgi:hypothetical protein
MHPCCLWSPGFSDIVTVAVFLNVANILDAAVGAPVFMQVCMTSLLLMLSYDVVVYPFALLQASFLLITTPLLLVSLPLLCPFCCLRSFVAVVLLFLSALHHGLAYVSIFIVDAFVECILLRVSQLLQAAPAFVFVSAVADSLYVACVPALAGFTCFCIRPCSCRQSLCCWCFLLLL